jgi:hypothetical protein
VVVKYDIRWADAGTNSFPEDKALTIDAPATNAEGEAEAPLYHWSDGTPVK